MYSKYEKNKLLNILVFNWRDILNPKAGGSEIFLHNIAKIWVILGHRVVIFTSRFKGSKYYQEIDGVKVIRAGNLIMLRVYAFIYYRLFFRGRFDILIEVKNGGVPWFCKFFVKDPLCVLVHQVGRDFREYDPKKSTWFYELPFPFYIFAYIIEAGLLRIYRGLHILVVSNSTRQSILDLGFISNKIHYVPEGGNSSDYKNIKKYNKIHNKSDMLPFIYLGRIRPSKRVDHIIKAIAIAKCKYNNIHLWIVGSSDYSYRKKLESLIERLNLLNNVEFLGYINEYDKKIFLKKSLALLIASIREGWGLVVTEANRVGTPAIGYNVPGLKDSIQNNKTGLLCNNGDIKSFAKCIITFIENNDLQKSLSINAIEYSKKFNWDISAKIYLKHIYNILKVNLH